MLKLCTRYAPMTKQVEVQNVIESATLNELVAALGETEVTRLAIKAHNEEAIIRAKERERDHRHTVP